MLIFAALKAEYLPTNIPLSQPGGAIRKDPPESFRAATGFATPDPEFFTAGDGFGCALNEQQPNLNQVPPPPFSGEKSSPTLFVNPSSRRPWGSLTCRSPSHSTPLRSPQADGYGSKSTPRTWVIGTPSWSRKSPAPPFSLTPLACPHSPRRRMSSLPSSFPRFPAPTTPPSWTLRNTKPISISTGSPSWSTLTSPQRQQRHRRRRLYRARHRCRHPDRLGRYSGHPVGQPPD